MPAPPDDVARNPGCCQKHKPGQFSPFGKGGGPARQRPAPKNERQDKRRTAGGTGKPGGAIERKLAAASGISVVITCSLIVRQDAAYFFK